MTEHSLLDIYDLAMNGENKTKWFSHYQPPFGVGARDGEVHVWLVEDTSVETTIDPNTMSASEFEEAVFDFVNGTQEN